VLPVAGGEKVGMGQLFLNFCFCITQLLIKNNTLNSTCEN